MTDVEKATNRSDKQADLYPSRTGQPARLIQRQDPVVYAAPAAAPPIAQALIDQYQKQGFMILDNLFSAEEVHIFHQELACLKADEMIRRCAETITETDSSAVRSIFRVHELSAIFKKLSTDSRLAGLARYILGDDIYIHQSRVNYKPGFRGHEFYWHSDFETWHVEDGMPRMRSLSMSVTLTENLPWNGPLMMIPGSHRYYAVCEGTTPLAHYRESLKKQQHGVPADSSLQTMLDQSEIVQATGKPGSVIVFDCNIMHGSNGNITPLPRSNVFFVYNAISNQVVSPFCDQEPRPEHLCTRSDITPIVEVAEKISYP